MLSLFLQEPDRSPPLTSLSSTSSSAFLTNVSGNPKFAIFFCIWNVMLQIGTSCRRFMELTLVYHLRGKKQFELNLLIWYTLKPKKKGMGIEIIIIFKMINKLWVGKLTNNNLNQNFIKNLPYIYIYLSYTNKGGGVVLYLIVNT